MPTIPVHRTPAPPAWRNAWDRTPWSAAHDIPVNAFRPEGSDHRPKTVARCVYDRECLYVFFRVDDRFVRAVHTDYMAPVCKDSCVECFVQSKSGGGYFNFEFNCIGTLYASYVLNPERTPAGLKAFTPLPAETARRIAVYHSLEGVIDPERTDPLRWWLGFALPFKVMEPFCGPLGDPRGQTWRANFYKCGDRTSHPHWAAWASVPEVNFHLPGCFGSLVFE